MPDLNALFLTVGSYCRREVITCAPADRLTDAAENMQRRNISSLVVCEDVPYLGHMTANLLRIAVPLGCCGRLTDEGKM